MPMRPGDQVCPVTPKVVPVQGIPEASCADAGHLAAPLAPLASPAPPVRRPARYLAAPRYPHLPWRPHAPRYPHVPWRPHAPCYPHLPWRPAPCYPQVL